VIAVQTAFPSALTCDLACERIDTCQVLSPQFDDASHHEHGRLQGLTMRGDSFLTCSTSGVDDACTCSADNLPITGFGHFADMTPGEFAQISFARTGADFAVACIPFDVLLTPARFTSFCITTRGLRRGDACGLCRTGMIIEETTQLAASQRLTFQFRQVARIVGRCPKRQCAPYSHDDSPNKLSITVHVHNLTSSIEKT
jgi:hypothetical protein